MKRFILSFGLAALVASCGSPSTQDTAADVGDTAVDSASPVTNSDGSDGSSSTDSSNSSGDAPLRNFADDAELSSLMERARDHASRRDDRTNALVEAFISQGLVEFEAGDAEAARNQFAHALQLDPEDPVANDYYNRVGLLLGDDDATLAAARTEARQLAAVRQEAARHQVQWLLDRGRGSLAEGDPEAALADFEDALLILSSHPELSSAGLVASDVAAMIDAAQGEKSIRDAALEAELALRASEALARQQAIDANRKRLRIEGLLDSANDAFLEEEYEAAISNLDEILRLDRGHAEALSLRDIVGRARSDAVARDLREIYSQEWRSTFDDLEKDVIVPTSLITFPDAEEWKEKDAITKSLSGQRGMPKGDLEVEQRLTEVRIPVNFQGEELDAVLQQLSAVASVNFIMSTEVQDYLSDNQYNLVDNREQSIERILRILLEDLSLPAMTWEVRDGIVRVITQTEARGDYILDFYDVNDLVQTPADYSIDDYNILPSGVEEDTFLAGVEDDEPLPTFTEDTLVSIIQDYVQPDTWSDDPERSITSTPGQLTVTTTRDVHDQITDLLTGLRRRVNTIINIETRIIEVEDSFLEDIGVDIRGLSPDQGDALEDFGQANAGGVGTPSNPSGIGTGIDSGAFYTGPNGDLKGRTENLFDSLLGEEDVLIGSGGFSLEALFLDDTNVNAVLRAVSKYQTSNIVNAPNLTLRSGQRGAIQVRTNRTYVRDFEPEIAQSAVIAEPELGIVKEGIVLDVRAVASNDRRFVTLELRPTFSELIPDQVTGDLLPEALVSLGTANANNVIVQLPELKIQRVRTTATIPDGATLLLGGLKTSLEQDYRSETPFLADIPLISTLFRREGEYTSKRKLLILLKATIIAPEESQPDTGFLR